MTRTAFEQLVEEAISELPEQFRQRLENIVVAVEDRPSACQRKTLGLGKHDTLFGLYEGVPLTERGPDFAGMPDRITVFQDPIEEACSTRKEMIREIRDTVVHEIGHYFGLDEDEIGAIESEYDYDDEE